jgi:predicted DNA-binding transcriptional regulator YafY
MSNRASKTFMKFLDKLNRFSNKHVIRIEENTKNLTREIFEKAIQNENKVRLIFKVKSAEECIPLGITEHKGRTFFNVFMNGKERMIGMDRISCFEVLKEKFKPLDTNTTVIFKLKSSLAEKYQIRENETVLADNRPDNIVIANRGENKEILLSRLLRYQDLCEIEHPKSYRNDMKEIIDNTLANYGV